MQKQPNFYIIHLIDTFMFGVTLFEMWTFGEEPWIDLNGTEILQKLDNGERLHKPDACSNSLYDVMLQVYNLQ